MSAERRPIPGWPDHTIDAEGRVRRHVEAHGRLYPCLVPCLDGQVQLRGARTATVVSVCQLMEDVWPELAVSEDTPDGDTLSADGAEAEDGQSH